MSLEDDGFLSEEAKKQAAEFATEYKQIFNYLRDVNTKAHQFLREAKVSNNDGRGVFAAAFLARALTAFQALSILAERGFLSECRVICRNILEVKFRLGFLERKDDAFILFLAEHDRSRIKRLRDMRDGKIRLGGLSLGFWTGITWPLRSGVIAGILTRKPPQNVYSSDFLLPPTPLLLSVARSRFLTIPIGELGSAVVWTLSRFALAGGPEKRSNLVFKERKQSMHASIRKYKTDSPAKVTRLVNEEFVPRIKKLPGFLAYYRRRDFGFCQRFRDEGQSGGIQ